MVLSMDRFKGKVAVVTGAATGIGEAIANQLVEDGLQVVGIGLDLEPLQINAKKLSNSKGKLHPFKADVSNETEFKSAFNWTETNLGPIHILVNCAGITLNTTLIEGETEQFRKLFEINVLAYCVGTREAIKSMKKHNINGHIIHINSVLGHYVPQLPNTNVYPAAKHAITALTETLRQEINREKLKIKITSVSPGLVISGLTTLNKNNTKETQKMLEAMPILKAEDIADGVRYALSTPEHVQVHELTIRPVGEQF